MRSTSTFVYEKPEFDCPLRSQNSDAFSLVLVEATTPNKWPTIARALSARIRTEATEGEENL